jgi:NitT/TauT family transport system permease protein
VSVAVDVIVRLGVAGDSVPPVSTVLARAVEQFGELDFVRQLVATVRAAVLGLAISFAIAVPVGILLGSFSPLHRAAEALIEFMRPIPSVALIPVALLVFGRADGFKAALVVYTTLWPLLFNTIYGIHDVDPVAKDTARVFGFTTPRILWRVSLPSALPFIFTGLRVAVSVAIIVTVSAELIGGTPTGLGSWIAQALTAGRRDLVFAGVLVAGLLGWGLDTLLAWVERRRLGWQPALRRSAA